MSYSPKIVLQLPLNDPSALAPFVEACLRDGVKLIAVVGDGCSEMEDQIDDLIIGDGSSGDRYITTSAHEDEQLSDVLEFAAVFDTGGEHDVQLVHL